MQDTPRFEEYSSNKEQPEGHFLVFIIPHLWRKVAAPRTVDSLNSRLEREPAECTYGLRPQREAAWWSSQAGQMAL